MMQKKWVVVAESSRARIFETMGFNQPLREIQDLAHPEGRLPARELKSDRPARIFRGREQEKHPVSPHVEPRRQEAINFARQIADLLENAGAKGEYNELILIAAPEFLGILRENLNPATEKRVVKTVNKNIVHQDEATIREYAAA
jgi:protein required for attachment to host cells